MSLVKGNSALFSILLLHLVMWSLWWSELVQLGVTCQEHFQLTSPAVDKASKFTLVRDSEVLDVTFVDCMHSEMYVYLF